MLMDGCTFDEYFLLTDELQGLMEGEGIDESKVVSGLTSIWTFECSTSRLLSIYMNPSSSVSAYRAELRSELARSDKDDRREKNKKSDFLIWRGALLHSNDQLPRDTSEASPIVAIGTSEKGALHLPHTAKPPKMRVS